MARQHGHPPVTFLGKGGSWIQNTLAPPCGSRWRCHGRGRLGLILFLLIPFLFKQWWSGSGGRVSHKGSPLHTALVERHKFLVLGGLPQQTVFWNQNLTHRNQQVKGGWLLLVCHFLDALQTFHGIAKILKRQFLRPLLHSHMAT